MSSLTVIQPRLPMPQGVEMPLGQWRVLCESIFPSAKTAGAVLMALDYCKARKLDIMKKPVHIVPMWSASAKAYVETVWPSITEVQTTASRTKEWAGMDAPQMGPMIEREFKGMLDAKHLNAKISYPEWISVTVYRLVNGERYGFTEPMYWMEAYARIGKTEVPNDQWAKRPIGQGIKVAKAFSLRAAFPEEGFHVAEEMEGHILEDVGVDGVIIDGNEPLKNASLFKNASLRNTFVKNVIESLRAAKTLDELKSIASLNKAKIDEMDANKNEHDLLAVESLKQQLQLAQERIKAPDNTPVEDVGTFDDVETPEQELNKQMDRAIGA